MNWRARIEAFAAEEGGDDAKLTLTQSLTSAERAAVHSECRRLGLGSKSEGSDDDGTRVVTVFRRAPGSAGAAKRGGRGGRGGRSKPNGNSPTAAAPQDAEEEDGVSAFDDSLADLRDAPFDLYKALRIPRAENGRGYSGGTARARASYHREAVRCHPDTVPKGCGACHGCGGVLKPRRWWHRSQATAPNAPEGDGEFGLLDEGEDDDFDDFAIASVPRRNEDAHRANSEPTREGSHAARLDLCPPCYARHVTSHVSQKVTFGDDGDAEAVERRGDDFVKVSALGDLGAERSRYDAAAYGALKRRRRMLAQRAAADNARALAAVSGRGVPDANGKPRDEDPEEDPDDDEDPDAPPDEAGVHSPTDAAAHASFVEPDDEDANIGYDDPDDDVASAKNLSSVTRFHAACVRFQKVTVAYLALRDPTRCRIYDEHGYGALVKAEAYAEDDVFDADPWDVYDRFFKGEDEEDRQYLLLHGGGGDSDDDEEDGSDEDGSDDGSDDDAMVEEALVRARHERFECGGEESAAAGGTKADAPPPRPPVSVLMAMGDKAPGAGGAAGEEDALPGLGGGDVWAALAKRYEADPVGEKRKRDDEEDEEDDEEDEEDDEEDEEDDEEDEEDDEEEEDDDEEEEDDDEEEEEDDEEEEEAEDNDPL